MRRLLALACLLGCSEWRLRPTFPEEAARRPVVHEQALLGLSETGDAAVAQLVDADGVDPELSLLIFDRQGGPTRKLISAPIKTARDAAERVRALGQRPAPVLVQALPALWPEAPAKARELGFSPRAPSLSEPGRQRWLAQGSPRAGSLPLVLELSNDGEGAALLLSDAPGGDQIELTRMPMAGVPIGAELFIENGVVWLSSGSVLPGRPLHRALGLRRALLSRGEAQLHNRHGLADYAAGDLDSARREFDRAIAVDPGFADALYNAAATAALSDRIAEAVAFLRRAAQADPARVQVLGRSDEDLRILRKRADVRALLGLWRPPPEDIPPP